jgi:hypothetical protein
VKSALIKALQHLRGRPPKGAGTSPKDRFLEALTRRLSVMWKEFNVESAPSESETGTSSGVNPADWIIVLDSIVHSIENRMSGEPGGRDYLEYLPEFFAPVKRIITFRQPPVNPPRDA